MTMKLRRQKRKRTTARTFESEFALEILKSDRLRVTILICAFGAVLPVTLTVAVLVYEDFQRIFHGNFKSFLVVLLTTMVTCLGFLTLEWFAIDRRIRQRRRGHSCLPYVSAVVETSLPI